MKIQKTRKSRQPADNQLIYSKIQSPLGPIYLLATNSHLLGLTNSKHDLEKLALRVSNLLPSYKNSKLLSEAAQQLAQYFSGTRKNFSLPIKTEGTSFQKIAWKVLSGIPYGKTITYSEQASAAANPKAVRAIGSANGKNPLPIIIPCHRVIAKGNNIGGYALGITKKHKLLVLEKSLAL
jgi:methylated-DNA-[protein]-cysteine S-methyltransferase